MGATQKALSKGVPVCAVPFGRDQRDVARRVELARAGVRLPSNKLTPAKLRDAVTRAMGMRDGAERVARGYEATGGPATAADRFEALAGSGRDQGDRILAGTADAPPSHDPADPKTKDRYGL
jgi:UDP:flavonoid glycosyltransferase YjiC (YdhE family)